MADEDVFPKIEEVDGKEAPKAPPAAIIETIEKEAPEAPPAATIETERKEAPEAHPFKSRVVEWVALAISLATAVTAVAAILVQRNLTSEQLRQANELGWNYDSGQVCNDYREQLIKLWELGLTAEQIKSWFSKEVGGPLPESENPGRSTRTAYDDRAEGCGSAESLLAELPKTPPSLAPVPG